MRSAGVEIEILIEYMSLLEKGKTTVEARKLLLWYKSFVLLINKNELVSVTLFSFEKGEEISTHAAESILEENNTITRNYYSWH